MEIMLHHRLSTLSNDVSFTGKITAINNNSLFTVTKNEQDYICPSLNGTIYKIGATVLVLAPCNVWEELIILGTVGGAN